MSSLGAPVRWVRSPSQTGPNCTPTPAFLEFAAVRVERRPSRAGCALCRRRPRLRSSKTAIPVSTPRRCSFRARKRTSNGEYIYQDYIYDDYGSDTNGAGAAALSPRRGDINYPTNNARYAGNAADLVEFRLDSALDSVLYRITLNSLLEADSTIIAIAYDTDRNT